MPSQPKIFHVDCGAVYEGSAATVITGLDHLEGETVAVLADGVYVGTQTVSSGSITLATAATKVIVGLPYTTQIETLPPDVGAPDGTAFGRPKRVSGITAHVVETGNGVQYGPDEDNLKDLPDLSDSELTTSDCEAAMIGGYGDGQIFFEMSAPLPFFLAAVSYDVSPGD